MGTADIYIDGVTKYYGRVRALDNVSLAIEEGQIFGIFGPNGAGKSTLFRTITGLTRPTRGEVYIRGAPVSLNYTKVRRHVSQLLELPEVYDYLTLWEYLRFFARMAKVEPRLIDGLVWDWIMNIGMLDQAHQDIRGFSIGQRQRMEVARAFLTNARIVLLDEPFIALDIAITERLHRYFDDWVREGRLIVITSHNLDAALKFVDEFAILSAGRVVDRVRLDEQHEVLLSIRTDDATKAAGTLEGMDDVIIQAVRATKVHVQCGSDTVPGIVRRLVEDGAEVYEVREENLIEAMYRRALRDARRR